MVFPPQQAATDLDKKETSHFTHSDTFPIPAEDKHERIQFLVKPQQVYSTYSQGALVPRP